ncbi:hypothetical protein B0T24DRAFT_697069 [Lasiosphaeria ovina]|uniref:Uncharacterized protein n=1 Tax=Lasiosphaeria ovina TaxID=92902 RepID=A0AAE0TUU6_9PEZI|nr:hypothetical protein B0T24DRAFT_697069 [Lasiosphaeria ovina]
MTSRWTSFVATNQDSSVDHAVDSYNAALSDYLASPPSTVPTPYSRPSSIRRKPDAFGQRDVHYGANTLDTSATGLTAPTEPAGGFINGMGYYNPRASQQLLPRPPSMIPEPPPKTKSFYDDLYGYESRRMRMGASAGQIAYSSRYGSDREEVTSSHPTPKSYNRESHQRKAEPSIGVNDIVASQTAPGRFQINDEVRLQLSSNLPAGTREAIIDQNVNAQDGLVDEEAVDTIMVSKYIETHMDDQKDLLDLVVMKANRAVEQSGLDGSGCANAPSKEGDNDDEEEDDSDEEEEDIIDDQAGQAGGP